MGIRVDSSVLLAIGEQEINTLYMHITEFYLSKGGYGKLPVKYYRDHTLQEEVQVLTPPLKKVYDFVDVENPIQNTIEVVGYQLIADYLLSKGVQISGDQETQGVFVPYTVQPQ